MNHHPITDLWRINSKMTFDSPDGQHFGGRHFTMEAPDAGTREALMLFEHTENIVLVACGGQSFYVLVISP